MSSLQDKLNQAKALANTDSDAIKPEDAVKDPSFVSPVEMPTDIEKEDVTSDMVIKEAQDKGFRVFKSVGLKRFFLRNGNIVEPLAGIFVAMTPEMEKELEYFSQGYNKSVEEITK